MALAMLGWGPSPSTTGAVRVRIEFDAPAGCAGADAFFAGIHARMAEAQLASAGEDGTLLRVRLTRAGSTVHGELRMRDPRGQAANRSVDGATCDEVVDVLALTASLALEGFSSPESASPADPSKADGADRSGAAASTGGADRATPGSETPSPPTPQDPASSSPHGTSVEVDAHPSADAELDPVEDLDAPGFELGIEAGLGEVVSPYLSTGGSVFFQITRGRAGRSSASFGMAVIHLRNTLLTPSQDVETRLTALELRACPIRLHPLSGFSLEPCVVGMGGWLSASEHAVSKPASATRSWWSLGGNLRALFDLGRRFDVALDATIHFPLFQRNFITTTPEETVAETPPVSVFAGLGVIYKL
jgi:hypothetical protein